MYLNWFAASLGFVYVYIYYIPTSLVQLYEIVVFIETLSLLSALVLITMLNHWLTCQSSIFT